MQTVQDQVDEKLEAVRAFDAMPWMERVELTKALGIQDILWQAARDKLDAEYHDSGHGIGSSDINHTAMAMFRNIWCEAHRTARTEARIAARDREDVLGWF